MLPNYPESRDIPCLSLNFWLLSLKEGHTASISKFLVGILYIPGNLKPVQYLSCMLCSVNAPSIQSEPVLWLKMNVGLVMRSTWMSSSLQSKLCPKNLQHRSWDAILTECSPENSKKKTIFKLHAMIFET